MKAGKWAIWPKSSPNLNLCSFPHRGTSLDFGSKMQDFFAKSTNSKEVVVFCDYNERHFIKTPQKLTFKVNFLCQKSSKSSNFFSIKDNNLEAHFLTFFVEIISR